VIKIKIEGLDEIRKGLEGFSDRRFNAACATALTRTAGEVKTAVRNELQRSIDRPTPYTLNSLFVKPATAARLEAVTFIKDDRATSKAGTPPTRYLLPQIEGGKRNVKRFERALQLAGHLPAGWVVVPGVGARLDAYGNIERGQIIQVLSQLRITLVAGTTRNLGFGKKGIAAQRKAGGRFFVIKPGRTAQPGVYQREFFGQSITPVMIFVKGAQYRRRIDFEGVARRAIARNLKPNIDRAIAEQVKRLASKQRGP
jgi:hypothetical protein